MQVDNSNINSSILLDATCSAYNCSNKIGEVAEGVTFHRFPLSKPDLLAKWLTAMRKDKWVPTKSDVLCSFHFADDQFVENNGYRFLVPHAVPTKFEVLAPPKTLFPSEWSTRLLTIRDIESDNRKGYVVEARIPLVNKEQFTEWLSAHEKLAQVSYVLLRNYPTTSKNLSYKVIESVEEGERKVNVAKAFEIPLSSLSTILKNKEKIFNASSSRVRKRVSKGNFPRLEQCLVSWMRQCRGQNIPIGGSLLKEKAKAFAKELGIEFSASEGRLTNFKKRNGIVFKKMCGESSSVDINVCSKWQNSLSDLIKEYETRNIFNTDETGLFFKCLPEKTFSFKKEKCNGGKHSKEQLTILLAVNMDGSEKITPLVIGKSAKPRCFKGINSFPTKYRSNKKAWMTTELFNEWLISLNSDMKIEKRHILLFLDNCIVHNNAPPLSNVKLQFFPPNSTSKLQPLDLGIIHNFKTFYRREVVKSILDNLEN
ncbi:tigger transposable element-derived protein 6 [Trichonephila clavipes]|nr:tigger transposable element-derived protein 6 [Trichonephila clavipes]